MAEGTNLKEHHGSAVTLSVRLKPVEHADQPVLANFTNVGVTQGIAYLDFGFIEPALLGAVAQRVQKGETLPKNMDGSLATRVALPLDALLRLQQQLGKVLVGLHRKPSDKS